MRHKFRRAARFLTFKCKNACANSPRAPPRGLGLIVTGERLDPSDITEQERAEIEQRIAELELEHRDLDAVIGRLVKDPTLDELQLRRLKKRKLLLKDQVIRLRARLVPDILA